MLGIYIHWPFCLSLCPYCDFNSYISKNIDENQLLKYYITELEYILEKIDVNQQLISIYFGGGTPSLMNPNFVEKLINKIAEYFKFENLEITLEVNPTTFEIQKFKDFKSAGINRISIGVQSFDDRELQFLGRKHSAKEAIIAIEESANIFKNFTFDLIYALPKQTLEQWGKNLQKALSFNSKHLSLYTLIIEPNTIFEKMVKIGRFLPKSQEEIAGFYEFTNKKIQENDFLQYEISNYCKRDFESKHNMIYWKNYDYIGIGAGAHGRIFFKNGFRYETECYAKPRDWMKSILEKNHGFKIEKKLKSTDQIKEILLSGLRIQSGIDLMDIQNRLKMNLIKYLNLKNLQILEKNRLLNYNENFLQLTNNGRNLLNSIIKMLLE